MVQSENSVIGFAAVLIAGLYLFDGIRLAVAQCIKMAPTMDKDKIIVVTVSGRGDKDVAAIARYRGENLYD